MSARISGLPRSTDREWGAWFGSRVEKADRGFSSECWMWRLTVNAKGYPLTRVRFGGKNYVRAHRLAYAALVAPIQDGLQIDHLCRQTGCVNPSHLELVTNLENQRRALPHRDYFAMRRRAACPRGHALTEDNLVRARRGHRRCLICQREAVRQWRLARRVAAA